jgi:hypothetical protein
MTQALQTALILLLLLQVKHLFADYFWQTPRMLRDRGRFWHLGRLHHAFLHAAFSAIIFLALGAPLIFSLLLGLAEWAAHYLIDFAKGWHAESHPQGPEEPGFWRAFGTDQLAHQLTYLAMIWAWASLAV